MNESPPSTLSFKHPKFIVFNIMLSLGMLTISSAAMLTSTEQSKISAYTLEQTYQLLNLSKNLQSGFYDHKLLITHYLHNPSTSLLENLQAIRSNVFGSLSRIKKMTGQSIEMQHQIKSIENVFRESINESESILPTKGGLVIVGPSISIITEGNINQLTNLLTLKLHAFDIYVQNRSNERQKLASLKVGIAQIVMMISLLIGIGILFYTLKTLRDEMIKRVETENRWRFAIEGTSDGIWDWNLETNKTYYSSKWAEIHGLSNGIVNNDMEIWERNIHPEDKPHVFSSVHDYLNNKTKTYISEHRIIDIHGNTKWILEQGVAVSRNKYGEPTRIIGVLRETTEHQLSRLALQDRESRLRGLFTAIPDLIWLKSPDGIYLTCNSRFERFYGKKESEIIGKTDYDFFDITLADSFLENDKKAMASSVPCINEEWITFADDGHAELVETTKTALYDEQGNVTGVLSISHDITERKSIENELKISAYVFEAQEGMIVTDANNIILRVNHAFTAITGYTAEEVIGKNPRILSSGKNNANFYNDMWESIKNKGSWSGEIWNRRRNGEVYPEYLTITAVKDQQATVTNYVATMADITSNKAAAKEIEVLAFYDPLTHLPNRRLFIDRLSHALASSTRSPNKGALLFIDLDNFKNLNDSLGHAVGDMLLLQVAERLSSCVREGDTVARLGGDEFVITLEDLSLQLDEAASKTKLIGEKILQLLSQPYNLGEYEYQITCSIGAALFHHNEQSQDELLKQADIAMYQAKKLGRNAICFFDPEMQTNINARVELERDLNIAINEQQFQLYYQVQLNSHGLAIGAEALIRWPHPELGLIPPAKFIPLAEESDLIISIGSWVLDIACAQLKQWQQNKRTQDLVLSVNVSAKQLHQVGFTTTVQNTINKYGINPNLLKLELTESMLLNSIEDTISIMSKLQAIGVRFSLDDFGTGYSSLQYLKRLPLNQLKIDQSFVRDIAVDESNRVIIRTIIAMAQSLGLETIAEGVETEAQRAYLLKSGCTQFQGYLLGKPVPIHEFETVL
jgi:diguanylate cyclase (GGDEF)-like protein/PAS domain S-box-containing protein